MLKLLQFETPTVSLHGVCHSIVLVVVVVLEHPPEHMVGCLHQQPLEVFSLPARCAPVGQENRHQEPAVHLPALEKKRVVSQQPVNQYETIMIEFDGLLPLIISQRSLDRIQGNLSPPLSHEMPLWQQTSSTNQGAGISPGCGFDRPEERSLQSSGWHSAPHHCARIISWVFWVNVNEYKCYETGASDIYKCPAGSCWASARERHQSSPSVLKCSVSFVCFCAFFNQNTCSVHNFMQGVLVNPSDTVLLQVVFSFGTFSFPPFQCVQTFSSSRWSTMPALHQDPLSPYVPHVLLEKRVKQNGDSVLGNCRKKSYSSVWLCETIFLFLSILSAI